MHAVIVGAGIGGLASAAALATAGVEVTVLERAERAGGKIREQIVAGRPVDAGPTVLTMREVFDELFDDAGATLDAEVSLARSETIARHAWDDGSTLDLFSDVERTSEAIGALAGSGEARAYRAFQAYSARILETVRGPFLRSQRPGPIDLLRATASLGWGAVGRIDAHRSMGRAIASYFQDGRLRQLFGRYATYAGSSPWEAPATLNVIAEVEREGVWIVEGGMTRLAEAVERLAKKRGAVVRTGAEVGRVVVARGRVVGVELANGERIDADAVVINADAAAVASGAFGEAAARAAHVPSQRSLSALTWAVVARAGGPLALTHHNVLFGDPEEHGDIWDRGALPTDPTVYVCALDRDGAVRPHGERSERFFCIVNAPARGARGGLSPEEIESCERRAWTRLARWTSLEARGVTRTTPADFERAFPCTGGALYGAASHGATSSLHRPSARTRIPGLYLAGGSVHPGAGVPMAATSGRLAARAVLADSSSTRRSRVAATAGSTSMP